MPTGGVSAANVGEWFAAGVYGVGAGSELCPPALAKEGRFDEITEKAREFVQAVKAAQAKAGKIKRIGLLSMDPFMGPMNQGEMR